MKALTIRQPYASLIVAEIKRWETRPSPPNGDMRPNGVRGLPGLPIDRGERIAIHAAATWDADWLGWHDRGSPKCETLAYLGADMTEDENSFQAYRCDQDSLPTGAIIGTVEVQMCLRVYDKDRLADDGLAQEWEYHVEVDGDRLTLCYETIVRDPSPRSVWGRMDISDQVLFGHWVPGGWAWQLANPEPFAAPIPVKGKQGVWEWAP